MSRRGVTGVTAATGLVMVALVLASTARQPGLMSRPSASAIPPALTFPDESISVRPTETATPEGVQGWDASGLIATMIQLLVAATVVALLIVLLLALRDLLRQVKPEVTRHTDPDFEIPEVPQELLDGADSSLEALERGEPRNAIVATWVTLEAAAGAGGLPRHPAETSAEYVGRVLRVWDVDAPSLAELAALYREARFSTHPLSEQHRHRAVVALSTIRMDLGRARADSATLPAVEPAPHQGGLP